MSRSIYNPDCGHAWMVVAACFIINFIMAGLLRAAGVLYVALINVYGVSRETATMPFSLRFCVRNMSGPLVGALGQRFGVRPVVVMGGFMCGLGGILSYLASDVTWITVAWGGIHGLGYGLCNIIHVLMINRYFDKYKGIALGINYTGDCFGTFLLPLMLDFLLEVYGLKGTFLILAGISLNVVPAALLLSDPPWEGGNPSISFENLNNETKRASTIESLDMKIARGDKNGDIEILYDISPCDISNENKGKEKNPDLCHSHPETETDNNQVNFQQQLALLGRRHDIPDFNRNHRVSDFSLENVVNRLKTTSLILADERIKQKCWSHSMTQGKSRTDSQMSASSCPSCFGKQIEGALYKSQYLHPSSAYLQARMPGFCDHNRRKSSLLNETLATNNALESNNGQNEEKPVYQIYTNACLMDECEKGTDKIKTHAQNTRKHKVGYQFIKTNIKPIFLIISITMAMYVFLFISVFTIIIDYAADNNVAPDYGKYLILCFSVTDVFGRIGFGFVLDKKMISLHNFAGLTTGLMGFCIFVIPLYKSFKFWIISFSACGFIQGGTCIMFPLLVEYYMEKNETSIALGCLNFYGGLLMLPVAPMIGFFRDRMGSYDGVFWTVGILCTLAGCLWIFEPCIVGKKETQKCLDFHCHEDRKNNQMHE